MNKIITILCCVIGCHTASGQISMSTIVDRYRVYQSLTGGNRLELVFNQNKYSQSDTAWFKAYYLQSDGRAVPGRQLMMADMVAPNGRSVQHFLFRMTDGVGVNQFIIPDTLSTGIYLIVARSITVMDKMFVKEIEVVKDKALERVADQATSTQLTMASQNEEMIGLRLRLTENSLDRYLTLHVVVTGSDKIIFTKNLTPNLTGVATIDIPAKNLQTNRNYVSVIDGGGRVLVNAIIELPSKKKINAIIEGEKGVANTRSKSTIRVMLKDENQRPIQGEFAVSITNANIESDTNSTSGATVATVLKASSGFENWATILSSQLNEVATNRTTDLSKRGIAYLYDGSTPVPRDTRIFFYMQENETLLQAVTDANGRFTLSLSGIQGDDEMIWFAQSPDVDLTDLNIVWENEINNLPTPTPSHVTDDADAFGVFMENKKFIDHSFGFYDTRDKLPKAVVRLSSLEERIPKADITVDVKKYVAFPEMNELIKEVVPTVSVRKAGDRYKVEIALQKGIPTGGPVYIVDGYVTMETAYFLSLKPADLSIIKVVTNPEKLQPLGWMVRNGIVIVSTLKGNARPPVEPARVVNGVRQPLPFRQGKVNDLERPLFRSTIFWNPSVRTRDDGKAVIEFFNTDDVGDIKVRIDGITSDNQRFSAERVFKGAALH